MHEKEIHTIKQGSRRWFFVEDDLLGSDPVFLDRFFDRSYIFNQARDIRTKKGRGSTVLYTLDSRDLVLRHYHRGGLWGILMKDRYFAASGGSQRALLEFKLLDYMFGQGLPVPRPFMARQEHKWAFVFNDIITYQIKDSEDLFAILKKRPLTEAEACSIGMTIACFFAHGVIHTDLNVHNIMLTRDQVYLIDFDKCYRTAIRQSHKEAMLSRLKRSFVKELQKDPAFYFREQDFNLIKKAALGCASA